MKKFEQIMQQIQAFTGLDVRVQIAQLLVFDALILNEDRHTNNILLLYNPPRKNVAACTNFNSSFSMQLVGLE